MDGIPVLLREVAEVSKRVPGLEQVHQMCNFAARQVPIEDHGMHRIPEVHRLRLRVLSSEKAIAGRIKTGLQVPIASTLD